MTTRPTPQLLAEIVAAVPEMLRGAISTLWVEPRPSGGWQVRLTYALPVAAYPGEITGTRQHQIAVDDRDLPLGVHVTDRARYPDSVHPLLVWGDDPRPHIDHQIRQLSANGTLGSLDASIHHAPDGDQWCVKTHAGSDAERAAWLRALLQRGPRD